MSGEEETVPLAREEVAVAKREVPEGGVRVHVVPETREQTVEVSLSAEQPVVERVPVGRFVEAAPSVRTEGDVTIVPVLEERATVTVRLFLREELHVHTRREMRRERHTVTLRSDVPQIEDMAGNPAAEPNDRPGESKT